MSTTYTVTEHVNHGSVCKTVSATSDSITLALVKLADDPTSYLGAVGLPLVIRALLAEPDKTYPYGWSDYSVETDQDDEPEPFDHDTADGKYDVVIERDVTDRPAWAAYLFWVNGSGDISDPLATGLGDTPQAALNEMMLNDWETPS